MGTSRHILQFFGDKLGTSRHKTQVLGGKSGTSRHKTQVFGGKLGTSRLKTQLFGVCKKQVFGVDRVLVGVKQVFGYSGINRVLLGINTSIWGYYGHK